MRGPDAAADAVEDRGLLAVDVAPRAPGSARWQDVQLSSPSRSSPASTGSVFGSAANRSKPATTGWASAAAGRGAGAGRERPTSSPTAARPSRVRAGSDIDAISQGVSRGLVISGRVAVRRAVRGFSRTSTIPEIAREAMLRGIVGRGVVSWGKAGRWRKD